MNGTKLYVLLQNNIKNNGPQHPLSLVSHLILGSSTLQGFINNTKATGPEDDYALALVDHIGNLAEIYVGTEYEDTLNDFYFEARTHLGFPAI